MKQARLERSVKLDGKQAWSLMVAVIVFALFAASILILTRAATSSVSLEAESAQLTGGAQSIIDATASGGSGVRFSDGMIQPTTYTVAVAGDIQKPASNLIHGNDTASLIRDTIQPQYILALGDLQYDNGTLSDFQTYFSQTWGASDLKVKLYPTPGNHEYNTSGADGFYRYFAANNASINGKAVTGPANEGYYAFDIGTKWRAYSLNSETLGSNVSAQNSFLASDMAANPRPCSIVFMHRPYYDYGTTHDGEADSMLPIYKTFYNNGGDIVLAGHEHNYQRFKQVNPNTDTEDTARGLYSFVIGDGGTTNLYNSFGSNKHNANNLVAKYNGTGWGVLKLVLSDTGFTYSHVPIDAGGFTDSGTGTCH